MKALARRHESAATKEAAHEIDHVDGLDRAAGHAAAGKDRLLLIACSSCAQPSASINAAGGIPGPGAITFKSAIISYRCGNDILEGIEECDDGNNANGDGCNEICLAE